MILTKVIKIGFHRNLLIKCGYTNHLFLLSISVLTNILASSLNFSSVFSQVLFLPLNNLLKVVIPMMSIVPFYCHNSIALVIDSPHLYPFVFSELSCLQLKTSQFQIPKQYGVIPYHIQNQRACYVEASSIYLPNNSAPLSFQNSTPLLERR